MLAAEAQAMLVALLSWTTALSTKSVAMSPSEAASGISAIRERFALPLDDGDLPLPLRLDDGDFFAGDMVIL